MASEESPTDGTSSIAWRDKFEQIVAENNNLRRVNGDLEERVLNMVETIAREKVLLGDEIDTLAQRLTQLSNENQRLGEKCATYKADCVTAVHLLQCSTPGEYVQTHNHSSYAHLKAMGDGRDASASSSMRVSSSFATFPPTATHFPPPPEDEAQPDDPLQITTPLASPTELSADSCLFIASMASKADYSLTGMRQCATCGTVVHVAERATQTITTRSLLSSQSCATFHPGEEDGVLLLGEREVRPAVFSLRADHVIDM